MAHVPRSSDLAPSFARRLWLPPRRTEALVGIAFALVLPWLAAWMADGLAMFAGFPSLPFLVATILATLVGRLVAAIVAVANSALLILAFRATSFTSVGVGDLQEMIGLVMFAAILFLVAYLLAARDASAQQADDARSAIEDLARQLASDRNTIHLIVHQQPNGVMVADADGNLSVVNRRAEEILGSGYRRVAPLEVPDEGVPWRARRPDGSTYAPREYPLVRSVRSGEIVSGEQMRIERLDGSVVDVEVDCAPLTMPEDGSVIGAVAVFQDISDRVAERERLQRATRAVRQLQAVTDAALAGLPFDELATRILERLQAVLEADAATLLLLDSAAGALMEHSSVGEVAGEHEPIPIPLGSGIAGSIAARRETLVVDDIGDYQAFRPWLANHMASLVGAPLVYRDRVTGVVHVSSRSPRRFTPEDVTVIELAAGRIASALERARLSDARSAMARALQGILRPAELPSIDGIDLAAAYRPYAPDDEIGGDFYDVFPQGERDWGLIVGDVAGKGPDAAAVMGLAAHSVRAFARYEPVPSSVLRALNETILSSERVATDRFVTACEIRLRPEADLAMLTVCVAGHPLPFVLRTSGRVEMVGEPGSLLGTFADPALIDIEVTLNAGDALVAYTDGLVERRGVSFAAGEEEVARALSSCVGRSAAEIVAILEGSLAEGRSVDDDIAIVVIRKS